MAKNDSTAAWLEKSPTDQNQARRDAVLDLNHLIPNRPPRARDAYTDDVLEAAIAASRRGCSWDAIALACKKNGLPRVQGSTIRRWVTELEAQEQQDGDALVVVQEWDQSPRNGHRKTPALASK